MMEEQLSLTGGTKSKGWGLRVTPSLMKGQFRGVAKRGV